MHIIAGLGNPDKKYNNTRHNTGYEVIDALAKELSISVTSSEHRALVGKAFYEGERLILAKPLTYMNLSGESIRPMCDYYDTDPTEDLLVIYDDVSMPLGQLRIRKKGSAGGHNGIKSIIQHLGSDSFWRIKIGVGAPEGEKDMVAHVLGHFSKDEEKLLEEAIKKACEAAKLIITGKTQEAMNLYNKKKEKPKKDKSPQDNAQADGKAQADTSLTVTAPGKEEKQDESL